MLSLSAWDWHDQDPGRNMLDAMALLHFTDRTGNRAPHRDREHPQQFHGIVGRMLADVPHRIWRIALTAAAQVRRSGRAHHLRMEGVCTHPGKVAK